MLRSLAVVALVTLLSMPVLGAPADREVETPLTFAKTVIGWILDSLEDFVSISELSESNSGKPCIGGEIDGTMDPYGDVCPEFTFNADEEEEPGNIDGTMDPYG